MYAAQAIYECAKDLTLQGGMQLPDLPALARIKDDEKPYFQQFYPPPMIDLSERSYDFLHDFDVSRARSGVKLIQDTLLDWSVKWPWKKFQRAFEVLVSSEARLDLWAMARTGHDWLEPEEEDQLQFKDLFFQSFLDDVTSTTWPGTMKVVLIRIPVHVPLRRQPFAQLMSLFKDLVT